MVKVKICANRSIEDAKISLNAGADIIGILVGQEHTSNDFVDKYTAKEICKFANNRCDVSMVTHLKNADEIILYNYILILQKMRSKKLLRNYLKYNLYV